MYEVEVKAKASHNTLRPQIISMGATHVATVNQRDEYYQHPLRDFAMTDEALRIRQERRIDEQGEQTTTLTYKGARVDTETKTREEIETRVANDDTTSNILARLGFSSVATVEKSREIYSIDSARICLDDVDNLGEFIEVELVTTGDDIDDATSRAHAILAELETSPEDSLTTSYLGLLLNNRL